MMNENPSVPQIPEREGWYTFTLKHFRNRQLGCIYYDHGRPIHMRIDMKSTAMSPETLALTSDWRPLGMAQ